MNLIKKYFTLIVFALLGNLAFAQVQDPASPGFDFTNPDTLTVDSSNMDPTLDMTNSKDPIDPTLKPYERIVLNVDSATNLITYSGVVEQEESGSDSLYLRTKRWAEKTLGKDTKIELDKRNQKIVYIAYVPAYSYLNKYTKRNIGRYEMRLTIYIKEGRFKYQISNLVHESVKPAGSTKANRNYFEYYYTSITNVRQNDAVLRAADKDLNELINSYKAALREPKIIDEDDW
jgi:hypothetical protein